MLKRPKKRSRILRVFYLIWLAGLALSGYSPGSAQAEGGNVHILEVRGVINPPAANYLDRELQDAAERNARLVVIVMDTPGGLESSMREMIQDILASPVPVAVYVSPSGSRAASAGLFLLYAGHIAAMAPGTNTGAAHPVGLSGEVDEVSAAKAVNDAAATIRALANERGRNADWAERAVRESVSVTEQEALDMNIIDLVARDLDDLLEQLDGRRVETAAGEVTLDVAEAARVDTQMTFADRLLHTISDPNIAFILLSVGSIGILAELYNPGALFPGITGAIALILAFFSLGNLPTNWAGVALIGLASVLFIAELSTDGTGFLGVGAVVAFLLGGLILFRPLRPGSPALPDLSVSSWVIAVTTLTMGGLVFLVMRQVVHTRHSPLKMGAEQYLDQTAVAHRDLTPTGKVWFEGQTWNAQVPSGRKVPAGKQVRIVGREGLTLLVEPAEEDRAIQRDA
jgi:membrane-bound serine protease (ClpP class)